jgi:hypothetical protein
VTYETWIETFGEQCPGRICACKREKGTAGQKKMGCECSLNNVRVDKSRTLRWGGHVTRMECLINKAPRHGGVDIRRKTQFFISILDGGK